jgi:cell division GTPase FtsZ
MSLKRANAVLMSMTGRQGSLKLHEARAAAGIIEELLRPDDMILGIVYDDGMGERIKITIIATDSGETKSEILEQTATPVASTANVAAVNSVAQARGFDDAYRATSWEDLEVPAFKRRLAR